MNKIESLTDNQKIELDEYIKECLNIGRSVAPLDHEKVENVIIKLYDKMNLPRPEFVYCASPHACSTEYSRRTESKKPLPISENMCGGQYWIYWQAFYKFGEKIGAKYSVEDAKMLNVWLEESKQLHVWFPFENAALISERPIRLSLNDNGAMHNEHEMAIEYSDGWGGYYLNGVRVPEYLVKTPSRDLSMGFFTNEINADVKAEFVRKFGVERMLGIGTMVDSYTKYDQEEQPWWWKSEYELWDMKNAFVGLDYQPFLKMLNQTTGIWHLEAVSPQCLDIEDALKERFGGRSMKIVGIS